MRNGFTYLVIRNSTLSGNVEKKVYLGLYEQHEGRLSEARERYPSPLFEVYSLLLIETSTGYNIDDSLAIKAVDVSNGVKMPYSITERGIEGAA